MPDWAVLDQVVREALRETLCPIGSFEWEGTSLSIRCEDKTLKLPFLDSELEDPHVVKMKVFDVVVREFEDRR